MRPAHTPSQRVLHLQPERPQAGSNLCCPQAKACILRALFIEPSIASVFVFGGQNHCTTTNRLSTIIKPSEAWLFSITLFTDVEDFFGRSDQFPLLVFDVHGEGWKVLLSICRLLANGL